MAGRPKHVEQEPPAIGARATIRHGFFRHPCKIVQVTGAGRYVKVTVDEKVYVFTRGPTGKYSRVQVEALWLLDLPVGGDSV